MNFVLTAVQYARTVNVTALSLRSVVICNSSLLPLLPPRRASLQQSILAAHPLLQRRGDLVGLGEELEELGEILQEGVHLR